MTLEIHDAENDTTSGAEEQEARLTPEQAKALARDIAGPQSADKRSNRERVIEEMIAEGISPAAIKNLLRLRDAEKADEEEENKQKEQREYVQAFNNELWKNADLALSEFESALPALTRPGTRKDLLAEMSDLFEQDDEFKAQRERIGKRMLPTKDAYRKAAQLVVDKFCEEAGISKRSSSQPDLTGAVPTAKTGGAGVTMESLNDIDRRRVRALMNTGTFDEKEAIAHIRNNKVAV